jgi:hypothetical protein
MSTEMKMHENEIEFLRNRVYVKNDETENLLKNMNSSF